MPGELVRVQGRHYRVSELLDFESLIGVDVETGRSKALSVRELAPVQDAPLPARDIETIADEDWKEAERRYAAIKPLLGPEIGRSEVERRAQEIGSSYSTLYRWLRRYRNAGSVEGLVPEKRGVKVGTKRLSPHAEEIIDEVIKSVYLTPQRRSVQKVVNEVRRRCLDAGLAVIPHANTIRSRVADVHPRDRLRKRGYREQARNRYRPTPGNFPNADYPLAVVQIDHTEVDVILVDDVYRKPIGRPWITVAIDVFSRMVVGYYLSFDPPSVTSVAMCVAHSILPKDEWLTLHGVDATWPTWGMMDVIHVDNGAEFHSEAFRNACMAHSIRIEYRPPREPNFGGHIERYLGTLAREIHDVPGTTFSSTEDRKGYDSEKNAVMTKSEFEKWIVTLLCKVYHKRLHSSIGMTPERKWEIGVFGNAESPGCGVPALPTSRLNLLLDFLPLFRRTVQTYGVAIDGLTYYADVLRPWINAEDPESPGKKRLFNLRRDPRDISKIWFYDPEMEQYHQLTFADQSLPTMSVWEYNLAKAKARSEGMKSVNEHEVLRALAELREQVDSASARTKKARRIQQRRKEHTKQVSPVSPVTPAPTNLETSPVNSAPVDLYDGDLDAFGDIS